MPLTDVRVCILWFVWTWQHKACILKEDANKILILTAPTSSLMHPDHLQQGITHWKLYECGVKHIYRHAHQPSKPSLSLSLSLSSGSPRLSGTRTSPFWILLELRVMEVVITKSTTGAVRRAKLQSKRHHQQINPRLFRPSCRPTNSVRALKVDHMSV